MAAPVRRRWAVFEQAWAGATEPTRWNLFHWSIWSTALIAELVLAIVLEDGRVFAWEQDVARELQRAGSVEALFRTVSFLTNTLSPAFALLFLCVVAVAFVLHRYQAAVLLLLTFPLHVLVQFPKALIERPRPSVLFEGSEELEGFRSFPSGHAEFVITFYGLLAYLAVRRLEPRWQRALVLGAWLVFAVTVGVGRIALGRHWPLDILASYLIGAGLLSGLIWLDCVFRQARSSGSSPEQATRRATRATRAPQPRR